MVEVSDKNYLSIVNESNPFVFVFYSPLCAPCLVAEQVFNIIEKQYPLITFCHIDISKNQKIQNKFQIQATPTILFIAPGGKITYVDTGTPPPETIHKNCKKIIAKKITGQKALIQYLKFWN